MITEFKLAILVRNDLKMPKGKLAAQASHASVEAAFMANKRIVKKWMGIGQKKIVLKVESLKELKKYLALAEEKGINNTYITDAGRTFLKPGTITCGAIGPASDEAVDSIVKDLKLL